jgi:hypothetical protein
LANAAAQACRGDIVIALNDSQLQIVKQGCRQRRA